jgi:hypothetical protein
MLARFDQAVRFFDRLRDGAANEDRFLSERDSSVCDSPHIQQVLHQPGELICLAAGDGQGALATRRVELRGRYGV